MVQHANLFVTKLQAAVGLNGKGITKSVWEKISKITKDVKEIYHKGITRRRDLQIEDISARCSDLQEISSAPLRYRLPLRMYRTSLSGYANRVQKQFFSRNNCKSFLGRPVRTGGALFGFASMFLIPDENSEDTGIEKRWNVYNNVCENINTIFTSARLEDEKQLDNISATSGNRISDFKLGNLIALGCNGAVYEAKLKSDVKTGHHVLNIAQRTEKAVKREKKPRKKLAVKVIYNFNSSNAGVIHKMVQSELVTTGRGSMHGISEGWQGGNRSRIKRLPFHPNIIRTQKAIIDKVPKDMDANHRHPASQPPPTGFGRSTTMFLVFPRYECTLDDFLKTKNVSLALKHLLCLQLLQGVKHLEENAVVHRDLKADNILIAHDSTNLPWLVISDFGCCIVAEDTNGLVFPFPSWNEDNRNGAADICAPEIASCLPGSSSVLDYQKSDAWAVGLLIKRIMEFGNLLEENLTDDETTFVLHHLMMSLLDEKKTKRISCGIASIVLHLQMFGPPVKNNITTAHVCDWLLLHSAETMAYKSTTSWGNDSVVCNIFSNFLSSLTAEELSSAFSLWRTFFVKYHVNTD